MSRRLLILDVDSTLLHTDPVQGGVEVPGRTRSAYLSAEACVALVDLSHRFDLVFATGRSWAGMQLLVSNLQQRGACIKAMCLENGGVLGLPGEWRMLEPMRNWTALRDAVDAHDNRSLLPLFVWQYDFWSCLVARVDDHDAAPLLAPLLLECAHCFDTDLDLYQDGRKIYLAGAAVNKWQALVALFGERAQAAVGLGDGLNDLCWLGQVALPGTLRDSDPQVVELVTSVGGIVSTQGGHAGTAELLQALLFEG